MRKLLALAFTLSAFLFFTSCKEDEEDGPTSKELQEAAVKSVSDAVAAKVSADASATGVNKDDANFSWTLTKKGADAPADLPRKDVEGLISSNTTWSKDTIYEINKRVTVVDGVTLTVEAGTRIEGDAQYSGAEASVLMIARGGKIMAEGTAENPIVMTSTEDDGTLDVSDRSLWGGLVILGKAPISAKTDPAQIEGVPADDTNGLYGGDVAGDNSGVIKYVSIRHGGTEIDAGSEINGLTLGGVGSGTVIDHVEVYGNKDDGVELFGGTVDLEWILVNQVGDDGIDIDQSYSGSVTNFLIYVGDSDEGLEIDGREGELLGGDADGFTLVNGTIEAKSGSVTCDFKSKARGSVTNLNANGGKIKLAASFDEETLEGKEDAASNLVDGSLTFSKVNASFEVYTKSFDE